MKLSFYGAAGEVTGACYLLETKETKILIDCGLFQGSRECEELNYEPFGFEPGEVELLIVSHGHLDHIGRIPKLFAKGFKGKIISTAPTRDLAELLLRDAFNVHNKEGEKPLYSEAHLEKALQHWEIASYASPIRHKDIEFCMHDAGHIIGSAVIEIKTDGKKILYTGDLGNMPSTLLPEPPFFKDANYLIIESTYGGREHESAEERVLNLERAVEDVTARGGTLMIPSFATERTQDILFLLNQMLHEKRIPEIPVFVDSPLAIKITGVFEKYVGFYKDDVKELYREHPSLFRFKKLRLTESVEESKAINNTRPPKVIVAGSGMLSGGRILHHAKRYLPDPNSILLIIGYQAAGSLGRRLIDGEKIVRIHGEEVAVQAEIRKITGFSAHADNPQLYAFVENSRETLAKIFMVHGEEAQALHFASEIQDRLGIPAVVPKLGEEFEI